MRLYIGEPNVGPGLMASRCADITCAMGGCKPSPIVCHIYCLLNSLPGHNYNFSSFGMNVPTAGPVAMI
jgi:hypothetical protein